MTVPPPGTLDTADQAGAWENEGGHGLGTRMNTLPAGQRACMACGHLGTSHDPIALRYCNATIERALTRRCICTNS